LIVGAALLASSASAQLFPTAATRWIEHDRRNDAALWLGLDFQRDRPTWGGRLTVAGAPSRDEWGGEGIASVWFDRVRPRSLGIHGQFAAVAERPIAGRATREALGRVAAGVMTGPVRWSVGALGVTSFHGRAIGGFGAARLRVGRVEVAGELGQLGTLGAAWQSRTFGIADPDTGIVGNTTRLGHGILSGSWRRARLELSGRVIRRSRLLDRAPIGWELGAGVTPVRGVKFVFTAGRAPVGPSLYLPFRRQLTFGMVLAETGRPAAADSTGLAAMPSFELRRDAADAATVLVIAPGARQVELVADFTDWAPRVLEPAGGGRFRAVLALAPGVYLVNLRIDGGPLRVPPGLEGVDDGFGGRAGILIAR
jgi:hypothetical protein